MVRRCTHWHKGTDLHVLQVLHHLEYGGIETWLLRVVRALPPDVRFSILLKGESPGRLAPEFEAAGVKVEVLPLRPRNVATWICDFRRAALQVDLVHSHVHAYSLLTAVGARLAGRRHIASFHNTKFPSQALSGNLAALRNAAAPALVWAGARFSSATTACSHAVARVVPGCQSIIYYGVEPARERQARVTRFPCADHHGFMILHVGSFTPQKNHGGLLRIVASLNEMGHAVHLILVGDGPLKGEVEMDVRRLGLSDRVTLLGTRSDVADVMLASDLLCMPSLHEGLPVVAIEAAAAGLPVFGYDVPGLDEVVASGETGVLCEANNEDALCSAISEALIDPQVMSTMGSKARARAAEMFSVEASVKDVIRLYETTSADC